MIQDRFAGPLPAWGAVGAEIVPDIAGYQRLKLHVLNTRPFGAGLSGPAARAHIMCARPSPIRNCCAFLDEMVAQEIAPALAPLDVAAYWRTVKARFANPMIDHRLAQIAEDGSLKLPQRLFPLLEANIKSRPRHRPHGEGGARPGCDLMATTARRAIPPMTGSRTGPRPAPTRPGRWTMQRCFPPSSAATPTAQRNSCEPSSDSRNSSAAFRGRDPQHPTSFLPPSWRSQLRGGDVAARCLRQRKPELRQMGVIKKTAAPEGAAAKYAREPSRGKNRALCVRHQVPLRPNMKI